MPTLPPLPAPAPEQLLGIEDVAKLWQVKPHVVRARMTKGAPQKRLGYVRIGRELKTTVPLLTEFLAANLKNPPRYPHRSSILERDVVARASLLIQELMRGGRVLVDEQGRFHVEPAPPPEKESPWLDRPGAGESSTPTVKESNDV